MADFDELHRDAIDNFSVTLGTLALQGSTISVVNSVVVWLESTADNWTDKSAEVPSSSISHDGTTVTFRLSPRTGSPQPTASTKYHVNVDVTMVDGRRFPVTPSLTIVGTAS